MIRLARKEDNQWIAPLIMSVLKDMELSILQIFSEELLQSLLLDAIKEPNYRYGYSRGLVYEHEVKVIGVIFGYPSYEEKGIDRPIGKILKKHNLDEKIKIFKELESLENEWYIDLIAVDEQYRGLGIGSKLLNEVTSSARKAKETMMGLNVDQMNIKAKQLYERNGFKKVTELTLSGHQYDHLQKSVDE